MSFCIKFYLNLTTRGGGMTSDRFLKLPAIRSEIYLWFRV